MTVQKPILVTGSHRSGSTWVGKTIAASPSVGYIHEPFRPFSPRPMRVCEAWFDHWFTYISKQNETLCRREIAKTIAFSYDVIGEIKKIESPRDAAYLMRNFSRTIFYRFARVRPLIKDPIAVFSAEWLAETFDMDVVVLIRHPAAFAGSLKRLHSTHPFADFLTQPLLMRDHLYPFESEIKQFAETEHDIIDQAILLWKLIHHTIYKYQQNHPDWIFVRHEDLSSDPERGFEDIFKRLNLEFNGPVKARIRKYTNRANPSRAPEGKSAFKLNSRENIWNWKQKLTDAEIGRIRSRLDDVASVFYSDKDW